MKIRTCVIVLCAGMWLAALPAGADPWKNESGNGHHWKSERRGHDKMHHRGHERTAHYDEHDRYRGYRAQGGPPPWAPAHGYRRKDDDDTRGGRYERRDADETGFERVSNKIGISSGRCNRQVVGTVVGGIVGGVIGNNVSSEENKRLGTVAGAIVGAVIGNKIGRNMDNADGRCTNQALERAPDGQVVAWKNPDTGYRYSVTPYKTYRRDDGRYCREYKFTAAKRDTHNYRETACRSDNGVWQKTR